MCVAAVRLVFMGMARGSSLGPRPGSVPPVKSASGKMAAVAAFAAAVS
jgi:hypothetical protein